MIKLFYRLTKSPHKWKWYIGLSLGCLLVPPTLLYFVLGLLRNNAYHGHFFLALYPLTVLIAMLGLMILMFIFNPPHPLDMLNKKIEEAKHEEGDDQPPA